MTMSRTTLTWTRGTEMASYREDDSVPGPAQRAALQYQRIANRQNRQNHLAVTFGSRFGRQRGDDCDDTCTTDCGHCKGNHSLARGLAQSAAGETIDLGDFSRYLNVCVKCGEPIVRTADADGVWYHTGSGLPPCDPSQVDPDAYLDIEGDKYDIATPKEV